MLLHRPPPLAILFLAQALYWCCSIIGITLTGLVGQQLTPWPWLATLPLALLVVGSLLSVGATARSIARRGARVTLQCGALFGVAGGLLSALGMLRGSFSLFALGILLVGVYQGSSGFYRFVALDGVAPALQGRAIAWVVSGGIAAALVAPTLALHSRHLLTTPLAGAYLVLALLAAAACCVLQALEGKTAPTQEIHASAPSKNRAPSAPIRRHALWQRPAIRQALVLTACAHGLMILVMNATPLAMSGHGHHLEASARVIQWHVLGMFLPSLWAGRAIDRWGAQRLAQAAVALLTASALSALAGWQPLYFLVSSLLLGAGWNVMLLAGTRLLTQAYQAEERSVAQPLMEWANSAMAAGMSLASGLLVQTLGWQAINAAMLVVLAAMLWWLRPLPAPALPVSRP